MGRVNYGHKFLADTQRKGLRTGVGVDVVVFEASSQAGSAEQPVASW